ncbi:Tf2-6, partial [Mucuna pruriens]
MLNSSLESLVQLLKECLRSSKTSFKKCLKDCHPFVELSIKLILCLGLRCLIILLTETQRYVTQLLGKSLVRESKSLFVMPIILVPKKDHTWRMSMVCRPISYIIIRYRHTIPCLDDFLDELYGACVFSKIDLRSRYHHIQMKEGDE